MLNRKANKLVSSTIILLTGVRVGDAHYFDNASDVFMRSLDSLAYYRQGNKHWEEGYSNLLDIGNECLRLLKIVHNDELSIWKQYQDIFNQGVEDNE